MVGRDPEAAIQPSMPSHAPSVPQGTRIILFLMDISFLPNTHGAKLYNLITNIQQNMTGFLCKKVELRHRVDDNATQLNLSHLKHCLGVIIAFAQTYPTEKILVPITFYWKGTGSTSETAIFECFKTNLSNLIFLVASGNDGQKIQENNSTYPVSLEFDSEVHNMIVIGAKTYDTATRTWVNSIKTNTTPNIVWSFSSSVLSDPDASNAGSFVGETSIATITAGMVIARYWQRHPGKVASDICSMLRGKHVCYLQHLEDNDDVSDEDEVEEEELGVS